MRVRPRKISKTRHRPPNRPATNGDPRARQQQLVLKNLASRLTDEESAELDALCETDHLCHVGPDPDAVRWPGDLTAGRRAERKALAQVAIGSCYGPDSAVDTVVRAATHLEYDFPSAPIDVDKNSLMAWDALRREYAERIIPPQLGIARIVRETRRLVENSCSLVTGDLGDVRGCFPGIKELVQFIQACLFGGTVYSFVAETDGKAVAKTKRVDYGCMPLYKRDFSKHVRAQVPVEILMRMYAECELWRAGAPPALRSNRWPPASDVPASVKSMSGSPGALAEYICVLSHAVRYAPAAQAAPSQDGPAGRSAPGRPAGGALTGSLRKKGPAGGGDRRGQEGMDAPGG